MPICSLHIVLIIYSDSGYPSLCLLVSYYPNAVRISSTFVFNIVLYWFMFALWEYYESVALIWVGILCYISGGSEVFVFAS